MPMKNPYRKTSAERQKEIIRAVLRIIGKQGITSLTTSTIAKEVGFTSGAIFRHFDSLEEIYREVVNYAIQKIMETFPANSLPPLERLRAFITKRVRLFESSPGLAWLLRSEQAYLTLPKNSVNALRKIAEQSKQYILVLLEEGMGMGTIRNDIAPEILLIPIIGTIHTMTGIPGIRKSTRSNKSELEQVLVALERMLISPDNSNKILK